jgi:hypothetical protein
MQSNSKSKLYHLQSLIAAGGVLGAFVGAAACSGASGSLKASTDDIAVEKPCTVFSTKDQRPLRPEELAALSDPVAKLILKGNCPSSLQEVTDTLRRVDTDGCADPGPGKPPAGVMTRLVSERAQEIGAPDVYRAVMTRDCGNRSDHELFLSVSGIRGDGDLPKNVELIGHDKSKGVFDFYTLEKGNWTFFGNSFDMVADGYDCANGACVPKAATKTRCASCHVGGGLVMKELSAPWGNWEGQLDTPGARAVFEKFSTVFGKGEIGEELESRVRHGNADWIPSRIQALKSKGVAEVLRPLFCSTDVNIRAEGQPNGSLNFFLFDDILIANNYSRGTHDFKDVNYSKLISAPNFNQRVVDASGAQLLSARGTKVVDTSLAFTFPVRSGQDLSYVEELVKQNIVDRDFVLDVEFMDFTRPLFSVARCGLLSAAPALAANKIDSQAVREGFKENLKGKGGLEGAFLASLNDRADEKSHITATRAFLDVCMARPKNELFADMLAVVSHTRNVMRGLKSKPEGQGGQGIIEFSETLPVDSLPDADRALDPVTCTLPK